LGCVTGLGQWLKLYIPLAMQITIAIIFYALLLPKLFAIDQAPVGLGVIYGQVAFVTCILLGIVTRITAILTIFISVCMIVLNVYVGGFDYTIGLFLVITFVLIFMGPGRFSIDKGLLKKEPFSGVKKFFQRTKTLPIKPNGLLKIQLEIGSLSIRGGSKQSIKISVKDPDNYDEPVPAVLVEGDLTGPSTSRKFDPSFTNKYGTLSYYWEIAPNDQLGVYTVQFKASTSSGSSIIETVDYTIVP
jgi:uncharacterized membrane protein YphA (DoxX/SURF4 family)